MWRSVCLTVCVLSPPIYGPQYKGRCLWALKAPDSRQLMVSVDIRYRPCSHVCTPPQIGGLSARHRLFEDLPLVHPELGPILGQSENHSASEYPTKFDLGEDGVCVLLWLAGWPRIEAPL